MAVVAAAVTTTASARADDETTASTTTSTTVLRSTTTAAAPVRPFTEEELAAQAQVPQDPDEQVATEEAPEYVGPPLPRVDLTQSRFDPRAQPAFAAYAAARAELDALKAAEQARVDTTNNSAASVIAAQHAVRCRPNQGAVINSCGAECRTGHAPVRTQFTCISSARKAKRTR